MPAGLDLHPLARVPRCPRCDGAPPRPDCHVCDGVGLLLGDRVARRPAPVRPRARELLAMVAVLSYAAVGAAFAGGA